MACIVSLPSLPQLGKGMGAKIGVRLINAEIILVSQNLISSRRTSANRLRFKLTIYSMVKLKFNLYLFERLTTFPIMSMVTLNN